MTGIVDRRLSSLDAAWPAASRLAELVSFAVRVDAGLLRRMRLELLPDADAAAESDLWFSPIAESRGDTGFQIAPEIAAELRLRLASPGRPPIGLVRGALRAAHTAVSPAIRLEEEINGTALEYGAGGRPAIEAALRAPLAALARGGADALDIARWAVNAAPRLHPIVRDTDNARTLVLSASLLLRGRARLTSTAPDRHQRIGALGWALPAKTRSQRLGVEFVPGGLQFRNATASSAVFDVPTTEPIIVEIEWESTGGIERRLVTAADGTIAPLDGDPVTARITTLRGDQYEVTSSAAATGTHRARRVLPPDRLLDACIPLQLPGHDAPIGLGFAAAARLIVTAASVVGTAPVVVDRQTARQLEVVGKKPQGTDLLALVVPIGADDASYETTLSPGGLADGEIERAAAAGFVAGRPAWYDIALAPGEVAQSIRSGVLLNPPSVPADELITAFLGSPLVAGQRAVGVIVRVHPPAAPDGYAGIDVATPSQLAGAVESAPRAAESAARESPQVFVSYVQEDRPAAESIRRLLQEAGIRVWMDERFNLSTNDRWVDEIRRQIEASAVVLVVLSRSVQDKPQSYVYAEWRLATGHARQFASDAAYIVPVVVDGATPSDLQAVRTAAPELFDRVWANAPGGMLDQPTIEVIRDGVRRARIVEPPRSRGRDIEDLLLTLLGGAFREALRGFERESTRVLVVTGSRHTAISEVPRAVNTIVRAEYRQTLVDLAAEPTTAFALAEQIAEGVGLASDRMPRPAVEAPARAVRDLARWIQSGLRESRDTHILSVLGFEHAALPPDAADLLDELIMNATESAAPLRLVLVNYDRPIPRAAGPTGIRRVELSPPTRQDIVRFFEGVFSLTGGRYDREAPDAAAASVLRVVPLPVEYETLREQLVAAARILMDAPS